MGIVRSSLSSLFHSLEELWHGPLHHFPDLGKCIIQEEVDNHLIHTVVILRAACSENKTPSVQEGSDKADPSYCQISKVLVLVCVLAKILGLQREVMLSPYVVNDLYLTVKIINSESL